MQGLPLVHQWTHVQNCAVRLSPAHVIADVSFRHLGCLVFVQRSLRPRPPHGSPRRRHQQGARANQIDPKRTILLDLQLQ
jgi:hypothetical protein